MNAQDKLADKWAGSDCTLDGKPARVRGRLLKFAIVGQTMGGVQVEYAWATVEHVMVNKGGAFKS